MSRQKSTKINISLEKFLYVNLLNGVTAWTIVKFHKYSVVKVFCLMKTSISAMSQSIILS